MSRYGRKRDANERQIIETLRAHGCYVQQLDGTGVPDLLVSWSGRLTLLEVKDPHNADGTGMRRSAPGPLSELTDAQTRWWTAWDNRKPSIVHNEDEALRAVGLRL